MDNRIPVSETFNIALAGIELILQVFLHVKYPTVQNQIVATPTWEGLIYNG